VNKLNNHDDIARFLEAQRAQNKLFLTKLYSRKDWSAAKTDGTLTPLGRQNDIFIHHTVIEPTFDAFADARRTQQVAFSREYADVSYNMLVHPCEGIVMEGRGRTVGAHTLDHNNTSYAIALMMNAQDDFEKYSYDTALVAAADAIVMQWQLDWLLTPRPNVRPHNSVFQTACPGKHVIARLAMIQQLAYGKIDMVNDKARFGQPIEATAHAQLFNFV